MEEQELRGERTLLPDEVTFVYGIHQQEERLQFTMKNDVAMDEVFGMEPGTDDDVTMFAYYDLKRGEVCDALDVKVFEEDGSKTWYVYRLSGEEKKLLLARMQPYCLEKTGMRLEAHSERFQLEQDGLLTNSQDETPQKHRPGRQIIFTDTNQHELFRLPDGGNLVMRMFGGGEITRPVVYVDKNHFAMGSDVHDMREFARTMESNGWTYRPETPGKGDVCDTYEIYQLRDGPEAREYEYTPYSYAKGKLHPTHYQLAYAGVLASEVTLEDLYTKHNRDDRPFGQSTKALSVSDIVVMNRGGERKAYYVDHIGFKECGEFLNPPRRKRSRQPKKRGKPER